MRLSKILAKVPAGTIFQDTQTHERWTVEELRRDAEQFGADAGGLDWRGGRTPGGMRRVGVQREDGIEWVLVEEWASKTDGG